MAAGSGSTSTSTTNVLPPSSVVIHTKAVLAMMLHAQRHKHDVIHGVLLGRTTTATPSSSSSTTTTTTAAAVVIVQDAIGISHGNAPSHTIIEIGLGLLMNQMSSSLTSNNDDHLEIVGWYTAPALLNDARAGPVALRIAASLATIGRDSSTNNNSNSTLNADPILVVLNNMAMAAFLKGEGNVQDIVDVYGKDFGQQWLEPLNGIKKIQEGVPMIDMKQMLDKARHENLHMDDLQDHLDDEGAEQRPWYPNATIWDQLGVKLVE